jgi:hypothetical protein
MTARSAPYFPQTATGDGTTKNFAVPFDFLADSHLIVINNGVLAALGTDYTIQGSAPNTPAIYTSHVSGADTSKKHVQFVTAPGNGNTPIARPSPANKIQQGPDVALFAHYRNQEIDDLPIVLVGDFGQTALLAPTALSFVAPMDGYVTGMDTYVTGVITTGGTLTAKIDGTTITGMVATVANSAPVGKVNSGVPSAQQASYTKVRRGQTITVLPASFATAGDVRVELKLQPADLT